MRLYGIACACVFLVLWVPLEATGAEVILDDVPSYKWYGGCGPTAAGMIIGYWDANGFGNLIAGGDGTSSWTTNQPAVKGMIASSGYFEDYWPTPDRQPPPAYHEDDCVADFMACSRDPLGRGISYSSRQDEGLAGYARYRGYADAGGGSVSSSQLWGFLVDEIDAGRPMEFFVDVTADGAADHFVTAIGYDDTSFRYACYNTYGFSVQWYDFAPPASGRSYGVHSGTWFDPGPAGDFNSDGEIDADDIDLLLADVNAGANTAIYDLTGDGNVDREDADRLVEGILATAYGDADLDREVSAADLSLLSANWLATEGQGWVTGDFTGDGAINGADLSLLAENWLWKGTKHAGIPEPTTLLLLALGAAVRLSGRRRTQSAH